MTLTRITTRKSEPVRLAVAEIQISQPEIPAKITGLFDRVYKWLQAAGGTTSSPNYAIYQQQSHGLIMRAGVPFEGPIEDSSETVRAFELPALETTHVHHIGDYSGIPAAFGEIHGWIHDNGKW